MVKMAEINGIAQRFRRKVTKIKQKIITGEVVDLINEKSDSFFTHT